MVPPQEMERADLEIAVSWVEEVLDISATVTHHHAHNHYV